MMSNNKVLTVSYGTFSCTLEGFDDSFDTMKAIAEYFRDLAAEDRYFGAEPPQPDAELLARIAEREVARRVDARAEEGRIVLTTEAPDAVAAPEPAPAPSPAPVAAAAAATAAVAIATDADDVDLSAIADAVNAEPVEAEAEVEAVAEPIAAEPEAPVATPVVEDVIADAVEDTAEVMEDVTPKPAPEVEILEAEVVEEAAPAPAPASDITDKLQRIRAVVAQSQTADDDDEFNEDEHADFAAPSTEAIDALATENEGTDEPGSDAVEAMLDARAETLADEALGEDTIEADKMLLAGLEDTDTKADDDTNVFDAEQDAPRTRVIKAKRADVEAAMAAGDIDGPADLGRMIEDGVAEEITEDASEQEEGQSTLSAEDEADLLRELAAVESELGSGSGTLVGLDEDEIQAARDAAATHAEIEDDDVTRLLAEADEKMDEPEGTRSRDAFRQLRAAVVARNADEGLQKASDGEGAENAYRSDLAEVVRPRRPAATGEGTARPKPAATPLKLVAEQRVDVEQPTAAAPEAAAGSIVPRRVSAEQAAQTADEDGGFAEFASEMGASALPELLEAAAAYMAFVEGHENFSRPQLMHKVRALDPEDFRREDGLRSFGQLLREGKIQKLSGGRFAATRDIGFKPQRAAG
ncbi:MAG: hypothetical protein HRU30_04445 [Rhodobacteraceae bacterium]|nr:hypothetical protein [Paracoccaceae bacterium]